MRKRRGGGEKLGEVGFLEVNSAFLFEGGGERGLGFIYSFFITCVFSIKKLLKGKRAWFFFHFKKKKKKKS